ncbi:elongation of very long chain fatty acids protein AAEL008004 [Rhipicephalus sanguineus]|uniref:Elongation of very long chain fatty acids protein n=1 Tax=Rhipicephalus sanguineus TaxID=34632 RepID=A0A9D4Q4E5_RHISA|nr:elongation of very long chain fatty acids protein AAEL008004 [Rhipicephalus sanguineus]KAH7967732.1 hypothetical protein HPB52_002085 [Rhipicephalus sanguineus]
MATSGFEKISTSDYGEFSRWSRPLYPRSDPRTRDWFLLGNPFFITLVVGGYLYIVYRGGPRLMAGRKPYDLRGVIKVYNIAMIVLNIIFGYHFLKYSYLGGDYNLFCQGMTYATDEKSMKILWWGYFYFFVRVADFMDTFFFVLRKKYSQITLQHTLHHALIVANGWLWYTLGGDGQSLFGVIINSSIHTVMYFYYFLAACGPEYRKYLWWKKYLTRAQIAQHLIIIVHGLIPLFYDCGYPRFFIYLALPQGLLGLALFLNFYVAAYRKKSAMEAAAAKEEALLKED